MHHPIDLLHILSPFGLQRVPYFLANLVMYFKEFIIFHSELLGV